MNVRIVIAAAVPVALTAAAVPVALTAAAVPVALVVGAGAVAAHADPVAPPVHYAVKLVGDVVETTLDGGYFQLAPDDRTVVIKGTAGTTLLTLPLSVRADGLEYPLPHRLSADARVLDLTAVKNAAAARPAAAEPVASATENQAALGAFATQFGVATAVGSFLGTALGAVAGAVVGLLGIIAGPTVIATVMMGAAVGAIIGTIVVGGPALVIAGIDLITTMVQPPGTSKWAHPNS
jgi:hypothetical protein